MLSVALALLLAFHATVAPTATAIVLHETTRGPELPRRAQTTIPSRALKRVASRTHRGGG